MALLGPAAEEGGGGEEPAQESGYNRQRQTLERRSWREEEERQIKANLPLNPPGAPPPQERDLSSCGRLWGDDHQMLADLA